ncbi:MAG TPA: DUF1697 domain-containing protein [Blastocatellia bacterium]|jgi:uncharacterized protein (DUF1697 family)|nr:DUF1697 domain-containing protein [Blastocatellia bacterium]
MSKQSVSKNITYVALLRGINVGGKNLISMQALKESFKKLGFGSVMTYINSGNIIFTSSQSDARALERKIERMLEREYNHAGKVVIRNITEMAELLKILPESTSDDKQWKHNVIFLRHTIDSGKILESLSPKPEIEEVKYYPGVLLWSARTSDLTRSHMLRLSKQDIYQEMTMRNLNTTKKIYELMKRVTE